MEKKITHRCNGNRTDFPEDVVPCTAVRFSDGTWANTCGEPCSWIMGKGGHGIPPYETNKDGTRFDPSIPDES